MPHQAILRRYAHQQAAVDAVRWNPLRGGRGPQLGTANARHILVVGGQGRGHRPGLKLPFRIS